MGIDWSRCYPKSGIDRAVLERLIEQQAIAFQSMWGWHSYSCSDFMFRELLYNLHHPTYQKASEELSALLEFPEWNEECGCSEDITDLAPCWRVSLIANTAIFPPAWRMSAYRTYLPDSLKAQLEEWQNWLEEIRCGEHEDYLCELHLYDAIDFLKYHGACLRGNAIASLAQTANWAKEPKLVEVRDRILQFPEPEIDFISLKVNLDPQHRKPGKQENFDSIYREVFEDIKTLIELTRAWDSQVRGRWKVRYSENSYSLTLEEFREIAFDGDLQRFFDWANRCATLGFSFYLDY